MAQERESNKTVWGNKQKRSIMVVNPPQHCTRWISHVEPPSSHSPTGVLFFSDAAVASSSSMNGTPLIVIKKDRDFACRRSDEFSFHLIFTVQTKLSEFFLLRQTLAQFPFQFFLNPKSLVRFNEMLCVSEIPYNKPLLWLHKQGNNENYCQNKVATEQNINPWWLS